MQQGIIKVLKSKKLYALLITALVVYVTYLFRDDLEKLESLGYFGAFLAMLVSSATIIFPAPGFLILFALGATYNPLILGAIGGIGAGLGELVGYYAGYSSSGVASRSKRYQQIEDRLQKSPRNAFITIAFLAFIPNPLFDVAGMAAGALQIPVKKFLVSTIIGKTLRCILIAFGGYLSIDWIRTLL